MALMNCPECGKEISDTVAVCPNCGFALKKKKRIVLPIAIVSIVLILAGVFAYFYYIKPNEIMNQAANLIERGKYSDADILLSSIPSNNRKEELLAQICVAEAKEAITSGNYSLAEEKLKKISPDSVPNELLEKINKQKADVLLGQGRYIEADEYYASLEQTDEIIALRKNLFFESRVLQCALRTKNDLIFPESMVLSEALCLNGGKSKNNDLSTDEVEVTEYNQPTILLHYRAKTRGGSVTDGFQRYTWNVNSKSYTQKVSVDSLKTDEKTPSYVEYMSSSEQLEYYEKQMEIAIINIDLFSASVILDDEQLTRVNGALQGTTSKSIDFIPNNEIVPLPTPERVQVTPKP